MSNTIPARSGPVAVRIKWESAGVEARETVIIPARARVKPAVLMVVGCTAAVEGVGWKTKGGGGARKLIS